jgi:hypothetical protein
MIRKSSIHRFAIISSLAVAFTTFLALVGKAEASNTGFDYYLDGIGYRE